MKKVLRALDLQGQGFCQEASRPAASPGPFSLQFIKLFPDWIILGLTSSMGTIVLSLILLGDIE